MEQKSIWRRALTVYGWISMILFVIIYGIELLPHQGPPPTIVFLRKNFGQVGLIILNIIIVLGFLGLFPFRKPTRHIWQSQGVFFAFVIALMTEMFGLPLLLFLLSPIIDVPRIAPNFFRAVGHWPSTVGTALSLLGLVLIAVGWRKIHSARGLVTDGIYKLMRHPQYTGIFLFTLGWILHWPSIITLSLWPLLIAAYVWLARFEEKQVAAEFGRAYEDYASRTKRFIPYVI